VNAPYGLTLLFFVPCDSFRITDTTLVLVKDRYSISIQKLTVVHVNATKHSLKVDTCPRCHISAMSYSPWFPHNQTLPPSPLVLAPPHLALSITISLSNYPVSSLGQLFALVFFYGLIP
jgi:hypothetical protein